MTKEKLTAADPDKNTTRLEAFSDGVFAIAITLLGLEMRVPSLTKSNENGGLARVLLAQWPVYVSFLISFFIILVIWLSHHQLFKLVHSMNKPLYFSNALLLCIVILVPFTTELVAEYFDTVYRNIAILVYTCLAVPVGFSFVAMLRTIIHYPAIRKKETDLSRVKRWCFRMWITTGFFLFASLLVLVIPYVSLSIIFAAALFWSFGKTY
jgi:uncharacterized membrane protein